VVDFKVKTHQCGVKHQNENQQYTYAKCMDEKPHTFETSRGNDKRFAPFGIPVRNYRRKT
jgi:hypothetical protein